MTQNQKKEILFNCFVRIIATYGDYMLTKPTTDSGVDFNVTYNIESTRRTGRRIFPSGQYLDLQLKVTTTAKIIEDNAIIKYDLEAKTYQDLIEHRDMGNSLISNARL